MSHSWKLGQTTRVGNWILTMFFVHTKSVIRPIYGRVFWTKPLTVVSRDHFFAVFDTLLLFPGQCFLPAMLFYFTNDRKITLQKHFVIINPFFARISVLHRHCYELEWAKYRMKQTQNEKWMRNMNEPGLIFCTQPSKKIGSCEKRDKNTNEIIKILYKNWIFY